MNDALVIDKLCKNYTGFQLQDVSFSVPEGSIMGFIGENGAGKSTTIKAMLHLIRRDGGQVQMMGLDSIRDELEIKKQIGVVFDEANFHPTLTPAAIDKIMGKIFSNWDGALYAQYLRRFELPGQKIVKEYSKGMKTKLAIAAALAHHPRLLILDEATSGLDPVVRDEVLDIFYEFVRDGRNAILMSSHITTDLDKVADYVTFIHQGRVVLTEKKERLLSGAGIARCRQEEWSALDRRYVARYRKEPGGAMELLLFDREAFRRQYPQMEVKDANIEEIMLCHIKGETP